MAKSAWEGEVLSVQPRIRLQRSYDERTHSYLGYVLRLRGTVAGAAREFVVAIGEGAHAEHRLRVGDRITGAAEPVADPRTETAEFYKASAIRIVARGTETATTTPPFLGIPPALGTYRARGHRRLAAATYAARCGTCLWGCEMAVEMIVDPWKPGRRRYRRETFCYGPKSCPAYRPGPTRKVPGRGGASWEEQDWVDEQATAHRGPDE